MNSAGPFYFLVGALGKYWYAPLAIFGAIAGIATKGLPIDLP